MPRIDEQEILRRLALISQIEPSPEATALAMERVRRVLVNMSEKKETSSQIKTVRIWGSIIRNRMLRFTAAAIITIFILLPLSYGAVKIIKTYFFEEKPVCIGGYTAITKTSLSSDYADENQARKVYEEINQLKKAGKCEKTFVKEWVENGIVFQLYEVRYTLASGEVVTVNEGNSQPVTDTNDADANRPDYGAVKITKVYFFEETPVCIGSYIVSTKTSLPGEYADENQAKKIYDEINQLKKAGKCEKTFVKEWVENGIVFQLHKVRYTLASGDVVTMNEGSGRPVNDINDADANQSEDEE
jgi:hypothetical protein